MFWYRGRHVRTSCGASGIDRIAASGCWRVWFPCCRRAGREQAGYRVIAGDNDYCTERSSPGVVVRPGLATPEGNVRDLRHPHRRAARSVEMRELYRHSDIDDRASYRDLDHDDRHHDDNDHGTDGHARPRHLRDGAAGVTAMSSSGESEELAPIRERSLQAWQAVASVVAPLTLVTPVLGYVGWVRNRAIFEYFGVSLSLVGFTPQDYLLRSAPVGFGGYSC